MHEWTILSFAGVTTVYICVGDFTELSVEKVLWLCTQSLVASEMSKKLKEPVWELSQKVFRQQKKID